MAADMIKNNKARKLPIGIQSFESLRRGDYVYVDKTQFIWKMLSEGKSYFLSRPRRFGKSLLVSTMAAYFSGKKELFHGLFIEEAENRKEENAWLAHPVLLFSLSGGQYRTKTGLEDVLRNVLERATKQYALTGDYAVTGTTVSVRFRSTIEQLYLKTGRTVVVLVDEYDKPLLETMMVDAAQEEENRQLYKSFFSVLKDEDTYVKFAFFTGVTKFSKVSIFSDLNHLRDISMEDEYAGICGVTEKELRKCFALEVTAMANKQKLTVEECYAKLARTYDGYHFSAEGDSVYNPYSLLNAFQKKDFGHYWFETGTPTFLINKLRESSITPEQLVDGVESTDDELKDYRAVDRNPIPLFYQSGYLTLAGFDDRFRIFSLKFPNEEVRLGFLHSLLPSFLGYREEEHPLSLRLLIGDLEKGAAESFVVRLQSLFASVPYPSQAALKYEEMWRNQIFLVLKLLGIYVASEVHTSKGRCDCVVQTEEFIYLFEFKMDQSADDALAQIEKKDYAGRFRADSRQIIKVGISFSSKEHNITEWKIS